MKRTDVKTDTVYAYREGKYGQIRPIMVRDTSTLWRSQGGFRHDDNRAYFTPRPLDEKGRPVHGGWVISEGAGLIATSFETHSYRDQSWRQWPIHEVKARLAKPDKDFLRTAKEHTFRLDDSPVSIVSLLINPRWIIGEYDEVMQSQEDEAERRRLLNAEKKAESGARVANAQRRVDALAAVGITVPDAAETKRWHYQADDDWEPDRYSGNTASVTLSLAQVDALLSLIPEGVRVQDPNLDEDGFSYLHPEGVALP